MIKAPQNPRPASAAAAATAAALATPAPAPVLGAGYKLPQGLELSVMEKAAALLEKSFRAQISKSQKKQGAAKASRSKSPLEAAGGNAAIAAILEKYQRKAEQSTDSSLFADYTALLPALPTAAAGTGAGAGADTAASKDALLLQHFGSNEQLNYTIALSTACSHILCSTLNRAVIHCTPRALDDKLFLNTGEIFAKLPVWLLTFDLSACPECAPITALKLSRLTFRPVSTTAETKAKAQVEVLSSTHTNDPMFCEALGLSISTEHSPYSPLMQALLLDNSSCISDMLEGAFVYSETEDKNTTERSNTERQEQEDSDTDTDIFSAALTAQSQLRPLLNALRYVLYYLTHQDELKQEGKIAPALSNPSMDDCSKVRSLYELCTQSSLLPYQHYEL